MKAKPLQFAILGLMILIFGIIDLLMVNALIGTILTVVGAIMAINGWNQYKRNKPNIQPKR